MAVLIFAARRLRPFVFVFGSWPLMALTLGPTRRPRSLRLGGDLLDSDGRLAGLVASDHHRLGLLSLRLLIGRGLAFRLGLDRCLLRFRVLGVLGLALGDFLLHRRLRGVRQPSTHDSGLQLTDGHL